MFFQPLIKKLTWYLDRQHIIGKPDRNNGLEPSLETLFGYVLLNNPETIIPHCSAILRHPEKKSDLVRNPQLLAERGKQK
jgi:hypothetical protein